MTPAVRWPRVALLAPAFLVLAVGALAGLVRIGWPGSPAPAAAVIWHGPVLVGGFYGALIALERAVAVQKRWTFAAPALAATGALAAAFGADVRLAATLVAAGSAVFVGASIVVFARERAAFTAMLIGGALAWLVASALWILAAPVPRIVPWWIAFLALTIAGERLEMTRLTPMPSWSRSIFSAIGAVAIVACVVTLFAPVLGMRGLGLALVLLALWIGRFDAARRTLRTRGVTRFMALALFSAWAWLAVAGLVLLAAGRLSSGPLYDAALHTTFLGFGLSMIFGHAPIVLPAVTGLDVPYRRWMYAPLAVLHASVGLRVVCDLAGLFTLRRWAGLANAVAIALFVMTVALSAVAARQERSRRAATAGPVRLPA